MVSVGEYIKRERESRGVTIDEICDTTRIARRFIIAMEEDNFDLMPGDTLIVGFLRNYAKAIGINADEVVVKYYAYVKNKNILVQENEIADKPDGFGRRNIILVVVVFILLTGAYFFSDDQGEKRVETDRIAVEESLSSIYEGEEFKEEAEETKVSLAPAAVTAPPLPAEKTAAKKDVEKPSAKKEEVLTIKANENAWVNVVIDGNEVIDILLKPGEEVRYKGQESFLFTTGNLQGIEVMYNGQPFSFEGNKKSVLKNYLIKSPPSANQ